MSDETETTCQMYGGWSIAKLAAALAKAQGQMEIA